MKNILIWLLTLVAYWAGRLWLRASGPKGPDQGFAAQQRIEDLLPLPDTDRERQVTALVKGLVLGKMLRELYEQGIIFCFFCRKRMPVPEDQQWLFNVIPFSSCGACDPQ